MRVVTFYLGELVFTVPLSSAQEVVRAGENRTGWLFPLPEAPPAVIGLVAHRSLLVPVVDLRAVYTVSTPPPARGHVLLLRFSTLDDPRLRLAALLVDRVGGVETPSLRPGESPLPRAPRLATTATRTPANSQVAATQELLLPFDETRLGPLVGALAPAL